MNEQDVKRALENDLPIGANCYGIITSINPYDKSKRKKGLNYKEYSAFSGICKLSNEQIIKCYSWLDKDIIREEFLQRCADCPYCYEERIYTRQYLSNRYPSWVMALEQVDFDNPSVYVYFISDGEYVKIGVAKDLSKRLTALQTANARKLELLFAIPTNSEKTAFELEGILHNQYSHYAVSGEWFNILHHIVVAEWAKIFS